jgi:hypothetical protein
MAVGLGFMKHSTLKSHFCIYQAIGNLKQHVSFKFCAFINCYKDYAFYKNMSLMLLLVIDLNSSSEKKYVAVFQITANSISMETEFD